jgi:hypothetical protein
LLKELSEAYCYNCGTEDCDGCYRKMQNWSLSPVTAEKISKEIINILYKEEMNDNAK